MESVPIGVNHQIGNPIDDRPEGLGWGWFVHAPIAPDRTKADKSLYVDASGAGLWNGFSSFYSPSRLGFMSKSPFPSTPLQILTFRGDMDASPFKVQQELANEEEIRDIKREEARALAQLIYNAYKEWKQQ
ncbi:hypothetical protein CCB80_08725 [Armatimonadetes bacterium Uphvl-Ar1]|nr:hypothetical protein CCB80_08725 [Armatimonadetes bacterium Uphvl-Ar1]